nr:J domain-containing protein [uncultured Rhodopila sp.]
MPPLRTSLDPEGYYARLGVEPTAAQAAITAAFRRKARLLHPDVPETGDSAAFVAVKQAYDVLSNRQRREDYDRAARPVPVEALEPDIHPVWPVYQEYSAPPPLRPRFWDLRLVAWLGVGAVLCISLAEAVMHVRQPPKVVSAGIRPNAATVEPLSPEAHLAALYGPTPVSLPGPTNFYVIPAATPAVLWRLDPGRNVAIPDRQLPPFSTVHAVRLLRQNGMLEVLVRDKPNGYIDISHLSPGNESAARRGYCGYNAGALPYDGEVLDRMLYGGGRLRLDNRGVQPAVVKLRDQSGTVALSVFLAPGGHADIRDAPEGLYPAEFAVGELWSRACGTFAAGIRARRLDDGLTIRGSTALEITADAANLPSTIIEEQAFERKRD